jgi:hypothetical protein
MALEPSFQAIIGGKLTAAQIRRLRAYKLTDTTTCPPPLSRHVVHADTHACVQWSTVSLCAHFAATLGQPQSNKMTQTDRQTREEQER